MNKFVYSLLLLFNIFIHINGQYANSTNKCFYVTGKYVSNGNTIASKVFIRNSFEENIASCCDFCRGLINCLAWNYAYNTCTLFSSVQSYGTKGFYYTGKKSASKFWICDELANIWYYDLKSWIYQNSSISRANHKNCCDQCFFETNCKSWFFHENLSDCYHSKEDYEYSNSVVYDGMYTGSVHMSYIH